MPVSGAKTGVVGTATDSDGSDDGAADGEDNAKGGAVVLDDCSGRAGRVEVVSRRPQSNAMVESSCGFAQSSISPSRTPQTKHLRTSRRMRSGCRSKLSMDSGVGGKLERWNTEQCGEESCTAATASAQSEYERSLKRRVCSFQKNRSCCDGQGVEDDHRTANAFTTALANWSRLWMYHGQRARTCCSSHPNSTTISAVVPLFALHVL